MNTLLNPNAPALAYVPRDPAERLLARLFRTAQRHGTLENLQIVGPPGTGKSTLVAGFARQFAAPLTVVNCAAIRSGEDFFGRWGLENGQTRFVLEPLVEALRSHRVEIIHLEELNRAYAKSSDALHQILNGDPFHVPNVATYRPGAGKVIVATMNPQDAAGTYPVSQALLDRFPYRLELDDLPETKMVEIVLVAAGCTRPEARQTVRCLHAINDALEAPRFCLRHAIAAGRLRRDGASLAEALELCFLSHLDGEGGNASERCRARLATRGIGEGSAR